MREESKYPLSVAEVSGNRFSFIEAGTGPVVVLVHGSLCDCRYWHAQVRALSRHFRVIAPSLRGYWPAKWDGMGGGFSIAQHSQDLQDLLTHLEIQAAHVVGHSRGGRIALQWAADAPDRVRTLTLADPGLSTETPATAPQGTFREAASQLIANGEVEAGLSLFIDAVSGANTWRRMVPWFQEMARDNANTLLAQIREPNLPLPPDTLMRIGHPALLIGGALSPQPYPRILDTLELHLPHAERVTITGSSHGMNIGNPRAFNEAVTTFIQSN